MDYKDQRQQRTLHAYMIPPQNLDDVDEELTGCDWSTLQISSGYYTDARVSGSLTVVNSNFKRGRFIRIIVEFEDETKQELGTFAVSNDYGERVNGAYVQELQFISILHTLSFDYMPDVLVLGNGSYALNAIEKTIKEPGKTESSYVITDAVDYRVANVLVLEAGKTRLSRLFELCSLSDNRLDVDGHGRITISRYVLPSSKTPKFEFDTADERGVIKDDISRSSTWTETPTRCVVAYDYTEGSGDDAVEKHMFGEAWNNSTDPRGYWITDYEVVNDLNPPTKTNLNALAKKNLADKSIEKNEWTFESKFIPNLWEGDVVNLIINDKYDTYTGTRKCLVKNLDISGPFLDMTITLKETAGGDNE